MRISGIVKTSLIAFTVAGISACKKLPYKSVEAIPLTVSSKLNLLHHKTQNIKRDTTYHFFGYDTLEINNKFYSNIREYIKEINESAVKNTPKTKVGKHLERQMIPKRGGGFDQIFVWKNDYKPDYKEQKAVVVSDSVYTTNGSDYYIPVEYYGRKNK